MVSKSCSPWQAKRKCFAMARQIGTTPTALPAERRTHLSPGTTARSCQSTDPWAAISVGAAVQPSPKPLKNAPAPPPPRWASAPAEPG